MFGRGGFGFVPGNFRLQGELCERKGWSAVVFLRLLVLTYWDVLLEEGDTVDPGVGRRGGGDEG